MRIRNLKNTDELITNSKYLLKDYKEFKDKFNNLFNNKEKEEKRNQHRLKC